MKKINREVIGVLVIGIVMLSAIALIIPAMAAGEITATRDISTQTVNPGDTFSVEVTLTAEQEVEAPALDEDPPSGWEVTPVQSDGAIFKESTIEWIWTEKLSAGDSKTVVYNVTVPSDAEAGMYYINGNVSAYKVSPITVGGESEINVIGIDVIPPTIASITLDKYVVSPNEPEPIEITVKASDNVGVVSVTAKSFNTTWNSDATSLSLTSGTAASGIWTGAITAPSTAGTYNVSVVAKDAAGNTATNKTVLYKVSGGPTYVSGFISTNTTWTLSGSPYIVVGDVIVEEGVELTIEPGVTVKFDSGKSLIIDGILNASGNVANKITFTSNATSPAPGDWGAINIRENSPANLSEINWIVVKYGSKGINFEKSPQRINNSLFSENVYGVYSDNVYSTQLEIYNTSIFNNTYGIGSAGAYPGLSYISIFSSDIYKNTYGIYGPYGGNISIFNSKVYNNTHGVFNPYNCNLLIQYSDISKNTYGIQANGPTLIIYSNITYNNGGNGTSISKGAIHYTNIKGNTPYDLRNTGSSKINATCNWWGTTNTTLIDQHIYDYYDDYNLGKVIYVPFLTEPVTPENKPPIASFTYLPLNATVNQTITFNASSSYDPDGYIVNYTWNFGDGNITTTTTNPTINYTYSSAGSYTVNLTVEDNDGLTNSTYKVVSVTPTPPIIYVPDNYTKIQWAVDNATAGGTIIVRDGTYNENIVVDKPNLVIKSENGYEHTTIDGGGSGDTVKISADNVTIEGFTITGSGSGWPNAGLSIKSSRNTITSNKISKNSYGIYIESSSNYNTITSNTISNNSNYGIYLYSASNNTITSNNISNNRDGISLGSSSNNTITSNNISNKEDGIELYSSSNSNTITSNNISNNNHDGIYLRSSSNNKIYLNNIINNGNNVDSYYSTNIWNSTSPITYTYKGKTYTNYLGNYWSDYTGSDSDGNGIGDTPYSIDSDKDNYPLMEPFEEYFAPAPTVSISTDKYEYEAGDIMLINITIENPKDESEEVIFLWTLEIQDYNLSFEIKKISAILPPHFNKTFTLRWKIPSLKKSFNASWYVALANVTTYEIISEDDADWKYVPSKMAEDEAIPSEIAEEIMKTVEIEEVELPS